MKGNFVLFLLLAILSLTNAQVLPLNPASNQSQHEKTGHKEKPKSSSISETQSQPILKLFKRVNMDNVMGYANLASTGLMIASSATSLLDYFKLRREASKQKAAASSAAAAAAAAAAKTQAAANAAAKAAATQVAAQPKTIAQTVSQQTTSEAVTHQQTIATMATILTTPARTINVPTATTGVGSNQAQQPVSPQAHHVTMTIYPSAVSETEAANLAKTSESSANDNNAATKVAAYQ